MTSDLGKLSGRKTLRPLCPCSRFKHVYMCMGLLLLFRCDKDITLGATESTSDQVTSTLEHL